MKHNYFFRILLIIFLNGYFSVSGFANDWYISSSGSDATGVGTELSPWASFSKAHNLATSGDVIHVSGMIDMWSDPANTTFTPLSSGNSTTNKLGFTITKSLTIQGKSSASDGFNGTNGTNNTRIFQILSNYTVTLKNLKLANAVINSDLASGTPMGGAINMSNGNIIAENVIFDSNIAKGNANIVGSAIYIGGANTLGTSFTNCVFKKNTSEKAGAIYINNWSAGASDVNPNKIKFEMCAFVENESKTTNGGSALFIRSASNYTTCNIINCTFSKNKVSNTGNGGTIYMGGKSMSSTIVNIINCTVSENTTNGLVVNGAGVVVLSKSGNFIGRLNIYNSIIEGNTISTGSYTDLAFSDVAPIASTSTSTTIPTLMIENSIIGKYGSTSLTIPTGCIGSTNNFNTQVGSTLVAKLGTYNSTSNYYPLQSSSPAIGYGAKSFLSAVGVTTDQLGNIRPFTDDKCYAGAVELVEAGAQTPPALTADADANTVDNDIDITYTSNPTWQAAITAVKIGGTALSASDYTITDGNIRLKPSVGNSLLTVSGAKSVAIVATGYNDATVTQSINAGVATKLSMKRQPTAPASNGAMLAVQPQLNFQDQYSNNTTSADNVTASVGAGSWTIGGTLVKPMEVSGSVNYVSLSATSTSAVTGATITFTSGSLTPVTSAAFNIPAPPVVSSTVNASDLGLNANSVVNVNSGGELIIDQKTRVNYLIVAPNAKVTVLATDTLTATGGITLQSNAGSTATLIDNFDQPIITATVEQFLPQGRNWYVSSPVETNIATAANLTSAGAGSVSYYSEEHGWQDNYSGNLAEGIGYVAVSSAGTNTEKINFNGKLNSGDVPVTLTRKSTGGFAGYNLIANPYPSYINPMDAINANPNLDGTIWYRTRKTAAPFDYKFETVNTTSGVGTNAAGTGTVTGYIPPMQAFWVRTNSDNQLFTFTNTMRSHACNVTVGATTVPTTALKVKNQNSSSLLRIEVAGNSGTDEAVFYFNENASNGFDKYDSRKMSESATSKVPEIYSVADNEKLVINGLKSVTYEVEIPLGFIAKQAGDFSISKSEMTNFEAGTRIVLRDKFLSNTLFDLSDGLAYRFSSQQTADSNRFSLLFKAPGSTTGINNDLKSNVSVGVNDQRNIVISAPQNCEFSIYNVLGVLQQNGRTTTQQYTVNSTLQAGVYVVCVNNQSTRVIIK